MLSTPQAVFFAFVLFFSVVSFGETASKCWYSNCNNSTTCPEDVVECTAQTALDSVNYLNTIFNNTVSTAGLSSSYDCFIYGKNSSNYLVFSLSLILIFVFNFPGVWYSDNSEIDSYTLYRSCIPKNIKVCDIGKKSRRRRTAILVGAMSGHTCSQCTSNLCNSSVKLFTMWNVSLVMSVIFVIAQKWF